RTNIMVGYRQTNQKTDTGKTLTRWPVFVDHFKRVKRIESELKDIKSQLNSGTDSRKTAKAMPLSSLAKEGGIPGGLVKKC
ncbi:hypothetical protein, partial [Enterobacter hormaechei]|uniref:hypothetical protein n=1 Tax=Enterobacter hormaechei TaxID=158836 RepID=UPI003CC60EB6